MAAMAASRLADVPGAPMSMLMSSDAPAPPLCSDCRQPMKFVKAIPYLGPLPELFVSYCSRCKQAETKVQQRSAA
jgi:hypothetical protein